MNRYFVCGFVAMVAMTMGSLPGQTQVKTQRIYATLQKPGAAAGYVTSSLRLGVESAAGFFAMSGETLRVGNADYKIIENAQTSKDGKMYSLEDAQGRFLMCNSQAVSVSATPAGGAQWFVIRRYTAAQKTEFENTVRAQGKVGAQPGFTD